MIAHGAKVLFVGAAATLLCPAYANAQVADEVVLAIMRECAKIDDPTARLSCFDANIRSAGAAPRTAAPGASAVPQGGGAPVSSNTPQGFGAESMRVARQREAAEQRATAGAVRAQVTEVTPREPGIYLVTLEGGAQWLFNEGVSSSYRVPERGSTVEIERASLGSFLLRFNNQPPVPVRRVQ
jgi:hypothetical protein